MHKLCVLSSLMHACTLAVFPHQSSVVSLSKLLVREKDDTKDSRGIYLICSNRTEPEMYELVCRSMDERKTWISILRDAVNKCTRDGASGTRDPAMGRLR